MKKAFGILIIALLFIGMVLSPVSILSTHAASQTSINNAIAKGLAYLNETQDPDGSWNETFGYSAANTAMAVLAFENNGHYGWNTSDPYHTTVRNGLNYLFSTGQNVSLSSWPATCAGNPYVGGVSQGADWALDSFYTCYETPMVLLAIIGSNAQTKYTGAGPLGNLTYYVLAEEIVSWIAWAQNSNATYMGATDAQYWLGGWRYYAQYGQSDNSVSGWPTIGLLAAELWGINAPSWVKTELAQWTNIDQDMTGNASTNSLYGSFGYVGRDYIYGGIPETAEGIAELTYCGYSDTYANITAAEGYLYSDWNVYDGSWQVNIGGLYSMYAVTKAMRETIPTPTKYITNYNGTANIEWYNGTGQYADALVANQNASGMWINWMPWAESDEYSTSLTTAMGILVLQGGTGAAVVVKYTLTVTVLDANTLNPIDGATVAIVGPESLSSTTNASGIVQFADIQAGSYNVTTSMTGYATNTTSITLTSNVALTSGSAIKLQPLAHADFSIAASPDSLTILQGSSGTSTINVTSLNGFSAAVSLTASGAPTGVTLTLVPTSVTPASGGFATSTLTVAANATATLGSYTLTITGKSGSLTHNATISLTVTTSQVIKACIKFEPEKLNLKSVGQWVNCTIKLPRGYNASDINASTILLNGTIPAVNPELIWNCQHTRVLGLMVSFNQTDLQQLILASTHLTEGSIIVELTVTGSLYNGTQFQGTGEIKATVPVIKACVTFEPCKLNLKSSGQWVNCTIELPRGYNASDINASTILLNGTIPAEYPELIWNCEHTAVVGLMVSFNRTELQQLILESTQLTKGCITVALTVTGTLYNGTQFQGTGQVTVTMHHHHHHHCNHNNDHHHNGDNKQHNHH